MKPMRAGLVVAALAAQQEFIQRPDLLPSRPQIRAWRKRGLLTDHGQGERGYLLFDVAEVRDVALMRPPGACSRHGSTYWRGCRCDECRAVSRDVSRRDRARKRELAATGFDQFAHGVSGYGEWGCRCQVCVESRREKSRLESRQLKDAERRVQARTELTAVKSGQMWTGPEMEIAGRSDLTAEEAALMLGRTMNAVRGMRARLRYDPKVINLAGLSRRGDSGGTA